MKSLKEYIAHYENFNPDDKKYSIFYKVLGKNGKYRRARNSELDPDNDTRVEQKLCYKNGFIVKDYSGSNLPLKQANTSQETQQKARKHSEDSLYRERVHSDNKNIGNLDVTDNEKRLFRLYTGDSDICPRINSALRGFTKKTKEDEKIIESIDSVFERNPMENSAILFRKFQFSDVSGSVFVDKGYVSTTSSMQIAHDFKNVVYNGNTLKENKPFINIILLPKNSKAIEIGNFSKFKNEKEVLLMRNSKFQILSKDDKKKIILSQLVNSDSDILENIEDTPAQRYNESKDKKAFLRLMNDGEKITGFDFRISKKPKTKRRTPQIDNPDYDEEVSKEYWRLYKLLNKLKSREKKLEKENPSKLDSIKSRIEDIEGQLFDFNLDNDYKVHKKMDDPDKDLIEYKEDCLPLSEKYISEISKPCMVEVEKQGKDYIIRELISGEVVNETKLPRNLKNIERIKKFFDDRSVMTF